VADEAKRRLLMSVYDDAIMKDNILEAVYGGTNASDQIAKTLQYSESSVIALAQEMDERKHVKIVKVSSGGAIMLIILPKGKHFFETNSYLSELENEKKMTFPVVGHQINIGGNVEKSILSQDSDLRDNALESPKIESASSIIPANPPKKSWLEITAWIAGILVALITIYEFIIKPLMH
jgi:hypothetical protein